MPSQRRAYVVRDAGSASRMSKVYKVYPYTLQAVLEAIDDTRFRSFAEVPQVVARVDGREQTIICRFEHGRQVPIGRLPAI